MREELAMFVNDNYPPAKQELFKQAFVLFDEYEIDDYDTPFMEMLDVFDNEDYGSFITRFESLFTVSLLSIIKEHGITLIEEATLSQIVLFAQGILDIQSYEDKESIIRILETDYDNHEKLAQLLNLVSMEPVETIASVIEDMDQNIFIKVEDMARNEDTDTSEPVEETESIKKIISNLREFKTYCEFPDAIGFKILDMGFKVGLSFEIYGRYLKRFLVDYDDISIVAKEFFIILLMSKESYITPLSYYRKISSEYIDDLNVITKVDSELNKIQNEFEKFKSVMLQAKTNKVEIYYFGTNTSEVPAGQYKGLATGYEASFKFKDTLYTIKNKDRGVKGRDIPVTITKYPSGYFTVDFTQHA